MPAALKPITRKQKGGDAVAYNFVLTCGNLVQIFTADQFHEIPYEVQRLVQWGNEVDSIQIGLLEADDPFG